MFIDKKYFKYKIEDNNYNNKINITHMRIEKSKKIFFEEAPKIHNNYYDYSKVDFKGVCEEIIIICPKHGDFLQIARSHLKHGCEKCGVEKRKQTKIEKSKKKFFEEAPKIHNNYYDYSKAEFCGMCEKINITCPKHGQFLQKPIKHLKGQGCNKCGVERCADGQRKTLDEFVKQSKEKHGEDHYNYDDVEYVNCDTPVNIYCNFHNKSFKQTPWSHLVGYGCTDCGIEKSAKQRISLASQKFWEIANKDEQLDFSKFEYTKSSEKSSVICKTCNSSFQLSPNSYSRGCSCPFCINKSEAKLYDKISNTYETMRQCNYDWCKNVKTKCYFPFDFCIEEYKIIIELDGIQHFKTVKHFRKTPEEQKERDLYKQKCANDNGYSIIRIYQEDVYYDTFDWLKKLYETIEKIKNDRIIQNIYISKNDEYKDFDKIDTNNIIENVIINETYCEVCNITIKYNYKQHEATKKHKDNLLNITPDNSKKYFCKTCNKFITDKRRHYNTENHKSKISKEEWTKQIKELDENTTKKRVNVRVDTDIDVDELEVVEEEHEE
uniref:U1-type domain-containing protein n=1 Tax=viral metagenome TaxID=1070528 RepID=A0A6C0D4M8_9ZZZZ